MGMNEEIREMYCPNCNAKLTFLEIEKSKIYNRVLKRWIFRRYYKYECKKCKIKFIFNYKYELYGVEGSYENPNFLRFVFGRIASKQKEYVNMLKKNL